VPINSEHLASLTDADVIDQNGDKVGGVGQIYLDDASGQPAWVSVKSGLFGLRESFVPLGAAEVVNGNIQVPYAKDFVKDSPRIDAEHHLDDSQQALLYDYYGVDRSAAPSTGDSGGADRTAAFGSEQVADDLTDGRTDGEDEREAEESAESEEFAVAEEPAVTEEPVPHAAGGSGTTDAAAIGAAAAVAARGPAGQTAATGSEDHHAHYQQENPAAHSDWAAEESPEEPVATDWSVPSTDPADEEPTRVSRSGYSPDRPAAHSGAYEGHTSPAAAATTGAAAAAAGAAAEGAAAEGANAPEPGDAAQFGTVEPVMAETAVDEAGADDAVTGAAHQTGTGYPEPAEAPESPDGAEAAVAGAVASGEAAGGIAASDTETTAYEVPGAEQGTPIVDTEPGSELAVDTENPADGATLPAEDALTPEDARPADDTLVAGTDAGIEDTGEPDSFGPQGYHPDRDGADMTDEERARLNEARGAL